MPTDVRGAHVQPRYRLVLDTREVQLLEGENVIGRDPVAALWIDHPSVSRRHARVVVQNGKATLEDLKSKNGTHVNGKEVQGRARLTRRRRDPRGPGEDGVPRGVADDHAHGAESVKSQA